VEQNVPDYHHLLRVLPRCFTEVMLRVANPFRPFFPSYFKNGPKGAHAFKLFQGEMRLLLDKLQSRGAPSEDDQDIAAQLYRVLKEHPEIPEGRILSEIGMLFVEGFETTGHTTSWTLSQVRGRGFTPPPPPPPPPPAEVAAVVAAAQACRQSPVVDEGWLPVGQPITLV
jgi:hypothetical protein